MSTDLTKYIQSVLEEIRNLKNPNLDYESKK